MKSRSNIKEVFEECRGKGLLIELGSSYCSGPLIEEGTKGSGWICAAAQDDDRIMEDIEGEGSAEVTWFFGPLGKISSIASILVDIFTKKGYIVKWNKSMGGKITAVIEEEDLPLDFLEGWNNESDDDKPDLDAESYASDDENRINPEEEVVFNKQEEEQSAIFQSDEDEDEDEDEEEGPVIDPCSEEDDEEDKEDVDENEDEN
jgi:hypothetical protein